MQGIGRRECVEILKYFSNQTPAAAPATTFVGFSTAVVASDGSGIAEPTIGTGGYNRQTCPFSAVATPAVGAVTILQNSATISWGASTAAWSTGATSLTQVVYYNASTGVTEAVFRAAGTLASAFQVNGANVTVSAAAGAFQLTLAQT